MLGNKRIRIVPAHPNHVLSILKHDLKKKKEKKENKEKKEGEHGGRKQGNVFGTVYKHGKGRTF